MDIKGMLKEKIDPIVEKIKTDKEIAAKFQKDPISTVEELLGIDLPNDQLEALVEAVNTKLNLDNLAGGLGNLAGGLGKLFCK